MLLANMTPKKALKNLEQAVRQIQANADVHDVLRECIFTLTKLIENDSAPEVGEKEN